MDDCVGEGWWLFSEEEPHGLALVPYVGGVAYGGGVWAYLGISSTLAMLYDVSSGVSESDMLLKCEPRITQSPLSIASLMRFFLSAAVHIATNVFCFSHPKYWHRLSFIR